MKKLIGNKEKWILVPLYLIMFLISKYTKFTGCIFRHFLGVPCPGCGMSRALYNAVHLNFQESFYNHPMFWAVPILVLYFLFDGRLFKNKKLNLSCILVILIGFFGCWVYRLATNSIP